MLKNYMELIVDNLLPTILNEYKDICRCPRCIEDIKAITLNQLKPLYVVTEKGNIYAKLNELQMQFKADLTKEIIQAINIVSNNPRHNL